MSMGLPLVFDLIVSVLLIVTIAYAVVLNRKLAELRDSRAELERLITGFQAATNKAESNLDGLRAVAEEAGKPLQAGIEEARRCFDDLKFLIDRAGAATEGLETAVRDKRSAMGEKVRPSPPSKQWPGSGQGPARSPGLDAKRGQASTEQAALIKALEGIR